MKIALYPGSFDPITNGHLDIISRASNLFDKVIVVIAFNPEKTCRLPLETRLRILEEACKEFKNVEVASTEELTVNYAKRVDATILIRGMRVVSDFEFEWSLAAANSFIDRSIETVFLLSKVDFSFISSSSIYEMYLQGVDISPLIPQVVIEELNKISK